MRYRILFLTGLLSCLGPLHARGQVSTDPRALDQLKPPAVESKPPPPTRGRTPARPARPQAAAPTPARPGPATPAAIYGPPRPPPAPLPVAPPPAPVVPPPITVPTRPIPPPPPVPIVETAPGEALPLKDGLRVTFGPGRADLNPRTDGAVRTLAHSVPPLDPSVFTITSTAAPQPDDPSTPRRLALTRALAVRGVLIAEGVVSPRIIVKVVAGLAGTSDDPPDRVDVVITHPAQTPGASVNAGIAGTSSVPSAGGSKP